MSKSPAHIFNENSSLDSFKEAIRLLNGDFFFDTDEMLLLGEAYFKRYPDAFHHRDRNEVLMGYEIVRICVLEKAVSGYDQSVKDCLRSIVKDVSLINRHVSSCVKDRGYEQAYAVYSEIMQKINEIKYCIDRLPLGMVKERFIGGLAIFYNISYIVNVAFKAQKNNHL
ncbi:MAG TPA: hypothetical protein PK926_10415 [Spirochaetota bacterium]|nr:hypothetical protein [Spirochaetota bacterium]HPI90052.1 hypothetical protein [Spirochaetota bacterium]HPR47839.1 hypothetical protein [Spirochaetota bacterium]